MTDPTGVTGASLFALFSQMNTSELSRAYAELLRLFEGASTVAELKQQTKDVTELLWALKTGRVIDAEQAQAMDAELRTALGAAAPGGDAMIGRERHEQNDPLAALNLPQGIHAQALKLLGNIAQARTARDCERAADRAEGFGLGIETVRALNAASLEGLYLAFEHAATARLMVLEQ